MTIPKEIVEKYKWREKQKLVVKDKGHGKIEISDWRKKLDITLMSSTHCFDLILDFEMH